MGNPLPVVTSEKFKAQCSADGTARLRLALEGEADMQAVDDLEQLLADVHKAAEERGVEEVVVDLRPLEFMNSTCFKSFITWLRRLQQLAPAQQYRIRFLSDTEKYWQRRSLDALACFAVDLVQVEA